MDKEVIKPYFQYRIKNEVIVLDSQYTYEGDHLAVCTSTGIILVYNSPQDENTDEIEHAPTIEYRHENRNNPFTKLSWSFVNSSILAACTISRQIFYFQLDKTTLKLIATITTEAIPTFICFYPNFSTCLLSVGFSNGEIHLYNQKLALVYETRAHSEAVNWLSWERRFNESERNRWIVEYFSSRINKESRENTPLMISGSSDSEIGLWKIEKNSLILQHCFRAHDKQIRQVMWRPNYFNNSDGKQIVSCSEDGFAKFWDLTLKNGKFVEKMKGSKNFGGPVYRSEYNSLGSLIAISYYRNDEEKIETKIFKDNNGLLGEEIKMENS